MTIHSKGETAVVEPESILEGQGDRKHDDPQTGSPPTPYSLAHETVSRSNEDRRELLNELRIERAGQPVGVTGRQNGRGARRGLFLGVAALVVGGGVVAMNWGAILGKAPGASAEPASQQEEGRDLEAPATPEPAGGSAWPGEPTATPTPDQPGATARHGPSTVLDATGCVVARRKATVSAKITGKLASVFVEEGDRVQSGQVIALLDDSGVNAELALAESRLMAARSRAWELQVGLDHADKRLARSAELARRRLVSEERLDDDRLAKEALVAKLRSLEHEIEVARRERDVRVVEVADTRVRAPFSGVVIDKSAHPGEVVSPLSAGGGFTRSGIGTIVDMDSLEVEVDISEAYLQRVFPNQPAKVNLNAYPSHNYGAQVVAIVPTADRNKATVRVRIGLLEKDERVMPNMGVQVGFLSGAGEEVPAEVDPSEMGIES